MIKKVVENNIIFTPKNTKIDRHNGIYILSVNSISWNANNISQCHKITDVELKYLGKNGRIIEWQFSPIKGVMEFYLGHCLITQLIDIKLFKSEVYPPCLVFLQKHFIKQLIYKLLFI